MTARPNEISRHGIYLKRFQYLWPWSCTYWYRPIIGRGADEFGNRSVIVGLGPLGTFVFFKPWGRMYELCDD